MKNLDMFCLTLEPNHYNFIKKLGYIPVGLGEKIFSKDWFSDKPGINITIGSGKIIWISWKTVGLDFVNIENFGV